MPPCGENGILVLTLTSAHFTMKKVPRWRNGRRGGLKIRFLQGSVGSSPSLGSSQSGKQLVSNFLKLGCYPQVIQMSKGLGTFRVSVAPFSFVPFLPHLLCHRSQGR